GHPEPCAQPPPRDCGPRASSAPPDAPGPAIRPPRESAAAILTGPQKSRVWCELPCEHFSTEPPAQQSRLRTHPDPIPSEPYPSRSIVALLRLTVSRYPPSMEVRVDPARHGDH